MSLGPDNYCPDCGGHVGLAARMRPHKACRCPEPDLDFEVIPIAGYLDAARRFREKGGWL